MRFCFISIVFISILAAFSCERIPAGGKHEMAIVKLDANHDDLFSDSTGIYVVGIGNATNWQGMAANYFSGKKITAHFEYFEDGKLKVESDVDIKVSGGGSRKLPQKSFNVYAEKKYGEKYFRYPFFRNRTYQKYSALRLRVSGQDWESTHMRDALMHALVEDLHVYNQAYKPVVLYLNGKYWGIYNLREKFNKTYIRNKQSLHKKVELDILERRWNVEEGDSSNYMNMLRFIEKNSLAEDENYNQIKSEIDIPHYIDYVCSQIYFGNTDWPGNNIKFWRAYEEGAKWSWFLHDTDLGFDFAPIFGHPGGTGHNTFEFNMNDQEPGVIHNQPWATFLFRNLMRNKDFRIQFYRRMKQLLDTHFNSEKVINVIDSLEFQLESEMPRHIDRWKDEHEGIYKSMAEWRGNVEELRIFAKDRPAIILNFIDQYYDREGWEK